MVRAPCCEKMGLKKGPWTPEEDQILISYIDKYGHANWRALPKQAGLLRCGKSCRLRWINYLRPDIKRGNFSREEEETIINLHQMLGNRWSAIAASLPGRTDNEIKNVWHTHLKKRLKNSHGNNNSAETKASLLNSATKKTSTTTTTTTSIAFINNQSESEPSSSEFSSFTDMSIATGETKDHAQDMMNMTKSDAMEFSESFSEIDESFWSEALSAENSGNPFEFSDAGNELQHQSSFTSSDSVEFYNSSSMDDCMDFWYDLFISNGGSPELPEF